MLAGIRQCRILCDLDCLDVWRHLAVEELLFENLAPGELILYLWRSAPALVMGKHQNPWRECDLRGAAASGVRLARRLSGGGTVYHDPGNLNFCFLVPRDLYDRDEISRVVLAGLARLGVLARLGERQVLLLGERKISGNAFCLKRGRALHHGTLLVEADLARLESLLRPTLPLIETHGIRSVPSPVANLRAVYPELTLPGLAEALAEACRAALPAACEFLPIALPEPAALAERQARHATWEWLYGETPDFQIALPGPAGAWQLEVRHGLIAAARIETPAGERPLPELSARPFAAAAFAGLPAPPELLALP